MRLPPSLFSRLWWIGPIVAVGFLLVVNSARLARIDAVSARPGTEAAPAAGGNLILPEHDQESFGWLLETGIVRATGQWRLRHVDFDNAPFGRVTHRSAPYRWWLSAVAALTGGDSDGRTALDGAARWADPLLQIVVLLAVTVYVASAFGGWTAGVVALCLAFGYPLAAAFAPGSPHSLGLALGLGLFATLPLLRGLGATGKQARTAFIGAGVAGGVALWVSVAQTAPLLGAIVIGALLMTARPSGASTPPWRAWAIAGAVTVVVAWAIEYVPSAIEWKQVRAIHPLYALTWLGLGELLHVLTNRHPGTGRFGLARQDFLKLTVAVLAIAALPAVMIGYGNPGFTAPDAAATKLARLPGSPTWDSVSQWVKRDGLSGAFWATLLPLLVLIPAVRRWWRREAAPESIARLGLALGFTATLVAVACMRLQVWAAVDIGLLLVVTSLLAGEKLEGALRPRQIGWVVGLLVVLLPGTMAAVSAGRSASDPTLSPTEARGLSERTLAHWLARRIGPHPSVVLTPPEVTTALAYYGNLRGLGTPYWENSDGFGAAVRVAGTGSQDEALALVENRKLTQIVMPSWDPYLEEYARFGSADVSTSLVALLQHWLPPRWLRPIPFVAPPVPGMENDVAVVFEVVEVQDDPTALAHLGEYFIAMGDLRSAAAVAEALRSSFATDVGGMVARAEVARVIRDAKAYRAALADLSTALEEGRDRSLPWSLRVSLCLVLANAGQADSLQTQMDQALDEADEDRLRELADPTLFGFLGLMKAMNAEWPDPVQAEIAQSLLSPEQRQAL